jgi:predicted transcriptional regulator
MMSAMANVARSKPRAIRASDDLWAAVDKRAKADNVSTSDVVRAALAAYLKIDPEKTPLVTGREDRNVRSGRDKWHDEHP